MKSSHAFLTLTLALYVAACTKAAERAVDTLTAAPPTATTQPASRADLLRACRDTAAREEPAVHWAADTALTADLNYDGAPELVVWGSEGDSLFVFTVVECSGSRPGRVWSFPLNAFKVFGTTNLDIALTDPAPGEGYLAENCVATDTTAECQHLRTINPVLEAAYARGARGLSVGVVDRDHVHIYWDPEQHEFVTWRP
jgi:hypothetical protein